MEEIGPFTFASQRSAMNNASSIQSVELATLVLRTSPPKSSRHASPICSKISLVPRAKYQISIYSPSSEPT